MSAEGTRDTIIAAAPVRNVDLTLPAYYNEISIGTGHTPGGATFEVTPGGVLYIDNIYGGAGWFANSYYDSFACVGTSVRNHESIMGIVQNTALTGSSSHGVRGWNQTIGTSGLVGVANGYDFYADGTGTNYGPFTGTHDALMLPFEAARACIGDIVTDVRCVYRRDVSNTLFQVALSEHEPPDRLRSALGVICAIKDWDDQHVIAALQDSVKQMFPEYDAIRDVGYKVLAVNALGEGQVNVCGLGGDIQQDDLIVVSPMRGKGARQQDDIVRSYTVARAREACSFENPTDVKTIACIYLSG